MTRRKRTPAPDPANWAEAAPRRVLDGAQIVPASVEAEGRVFPLIALGFPGLPGEEPVTVQIVGTSASFRKFVAALGDAVTKANARVKRDEAELARNGDQP